jgi:hypothetical protein
MLFFPVIKNGRKFRSNLKSGKTLLQAAKERPFFGNPSAEPGKTNKEVSRAGSLNHEKRGSSAAHSPAPYNRPRNRRIGQLSLDKFTTRPTETRRPRHAHWFGAALAACCDSDSVK